YYAFIESPSAVPPKVRSPPYTHINIECKEATNPKPYVSANNLCGDLNKGKIPRNPMKQNVLGEPYPFELIRNQTLKFLSKTLPVLKADDTLPKVTQIIPDEPVDQFDDNGIGRRMGKSMRMEEERRVEEDARAPRKFCDGGGVFCALYRAIQGEPISSKLVAERREEAPAAYPPPPRYEGPPTPCPAKVEYATPVFAKNYQGSWRYVVQIPYEGYFTQTVEVTRCLQARCHYLDAPTAAASSAKANQHCDGHDEIGCFQVRLYYDWFLIPGSCKCWRPDYFAKYVRKRPSPDL
ncbi:AGAP005126-PB, partial [Anopheles gambiae str. PEST]